MDSLILAQALLWFTRLGLVPRRRFAPRDLCSSNDPHECRDVTVGRRMWDHIDEPPELLTRQVIAATPTNAGHCG